MKTKLTLFCIFLFISFQGFTQFTTVISDLARPASFIKIGDELFISEVSESRISKVNVNNFPTTATVVATDLSDLNAIALIDNSIFFCGQYYISKLDLSNNNVENILPMEFTRALTLYEDELYFSEYSTIMKIDPWDETPPISVVLDNTFGLSNISDLKFHEGELYIADIGLNKIFKTNLQDQTPTLTEIASGLEGVNDLLFDGDHLYYSESTGDKISRIDLSSTDLSPSEIVSGLDFPIGIIIIDDLLYVCNAGNDEVIRIDNFTTDLNELEMDKHLNLFPNPASNFIQIDGINHGEVVKIFNLLGQLEKTVIYDGNQINVSDLKSSLYYVKPVKRQGTFFVKVD